MPHKYPDAHPAVSGGVTNETAKQNVTLEWYDKLDKAFQVIQWFMHEFVGADNGDGVFVTERVNGVDGGLVAATSPSPTMALRILGGAFFVDDVPFKLTSDVTTPVLVAPTGGDRIDLVAASSEDAAFVILTGAEASTPSAPAVTAGMVALAEVYLRPGMTVINNDDTTAADEGYITDVRNKLNA